MVRERGVEGDVETLPSGAPAPRLEDATNVVPLVGDDHSAATQVRQAILALVVDGELRPGAALSEVALAERFDTSRTPVREALQALAQAGLAERGPRRSFVVRALEPDALDDAFEGLAEIEALAAGFAALRMTMVERSALEDLVGRGRRLAEAGDGRAYGAVNVAFHDALLAGAHNRTIARMAQGVRLELVAYRSEQFVRSDRLASSQSEHEAILACILARDAEGAARLMRRHIATTALTVRRMMDGA